MGKKSQSLSADAWRLAGLQHGMVARRQLLAIGFGTRSIEHRVARGRLHPTWRGVYAVGWPALTERRWWMGATLAAGEGSMLSHRSAAALWGIRAATPGPIVLSTRARHGVHRPRLIVHRRPGLSPEDLLACDLIPVTSPACTLVDLATELDPVALERAVNDADKRDLIDPESLRLSLDRFAGVPGVQPLRSLLDKLTFRLSDSDLEIFFRPIAASAGLPAPHTKVWVNGFEVDFFWPELGLIVETDGLRYHRTPSAQASDARRDRAHVIAGMSPLRFTHYEIRYEKRKVRVALLGVTKMLRRRVRL